MAASSAQILATPPSQIGIQDDKITDLTVRFQPALAVATELHRDQRRKGTSIPYVSHLLGLASIALEIGADEDQAIAALLHDALEDQGGAPCLADIRSQIGNRLAGMVSDCTDADTVPKTDQPR